LEERNFLSQFLPGDATNVLINQPLKTNSGDVAKKWLLLLGFNESMATVASKHSKMKH
jgi:hypothetical protein